jgi:hypothetical protein
MPSVALLSRPRTLFGGAALPSALPGLVAWGEGSSLGADGTSIASWTNLTLSGLDPAQGTGANQPVVAAAAINGQKAANFTGAAVLAFPAGALGWFRAVGGATLAAVIQPNAAVASSQALLFAQTGTGVTARADILTTAAAALLAQGRTLDADGFSGLGANGSLASGVPVIVTATFNYAAGTVTLSVNGASFAPIALASSGTTSNTDSTAISIGGRVGLTLFLNAKMGAYAMWNVEYSRVSLQGVLLRWSALYGITLSG